MSKKPIVATATETPRPKIRTWLNYVPDQRDYEQSVGLSLTVPDMALTPQEIIRDFTRGLPIPQLSPVYSDELLPDYRNMDLVDLQQQRELLNDRIKTLYEDLKRPPAVDDVKLPQNAPGDGVIPDDPKKGIKPNQDA